MPETCHWLNLLAVMCEGKGSTRPASHWEDWSVGEHVLLAYQPNNVIHTSGKCTGLYIPQHWYIKRQVSS